MTKMTECFDLPILYWIQEHLRCAFFDWLMPVITTLGNGGGIWIMLAVVLLCQPKYRRLGLKMGAALLIGLLLCNLTLKPLVARIRPYDYVAEHWGITVPLLVDAPRDFSFPSGHTIASFEAATVLVLHHRKWGVSALVLAGLIAFSRLYLFVHYPTDVLTSVVLGVGIGLLASWLVNRFVPKTSMIP